MQITKWEYSYANDDEELKELGEKGWEVCGLNQTSGIYTLKRPCGHFQVHEIPENAADYNYDYDR